MANHCIDCEFCGEDQRLTGNYGSCCAKAREIEKAKELKRQQDFALIKSFGIDCYRDNPDTIHINSASLIRFLRTIKK